MLVLLTQLVVGLVLSGSLGTVLYIGLVQVYRYVRRQPPGPILRVPFFGDTLAVVKGGFPAYHSRLAKKYGPVFRTTLFGESTVSVCDPALIQLLLHEDRDTLTVDWPKSAQVLLGEGPLTNLEGAAHQTLRKVLDPGMRRGSVLATLPFITRVMNERLRAWSTHHSVNMYFKSKEIPFMVIMLAAMGYKDEDVTLAVLERLSRSFSLFSRAIFSLPINLRGFDYFYALKSKNSVINEELDIHLERLKRRDAAGALGQQLGEILVSARDQGGKRVLSDAHIKDNLLLMLFAGHDTTANVMYHLVIELGCNERVLTKLRLEQQQVIRSHGERITADCLEEMPYAEAVLKEIMRMRPTVGGVFRRALKDFDLGPYHILKGTKLLLGLGHMIQADQRWADEDGDLALNRFYPERWQTQEGRRMGGHMPFGSGVRLCLGWQLATLELRVFLALLLRKYDWQILQDPQAGKYIFFPFIMPKYDVMVKFTRREDRQQGAVLPTPPQVVGRYAPSRSCASDAGSHCPLTSAPVQNCLT